MYKIQKIDALAGFEPTIFSSWFECHATEGSFLNIFPRLLEKLAPRRQFCAQERVHA
jgi:hypothetical protein